MSETVIRIGSRGSDLALWQAYFVKGELEKAGYQTSLEIIKTQGDKIQNLSFDKMEGKGFFTKEIEEALLKDRIDVAVHSHKDLETTNPEGLKIAAVSERASLHDLLIMNKESRDNNEKFELKSGAIVGTSSARRKSMLKSFRSDVQIKDLRGNVPTRIEKLRSGAYDAIILAAAGVERLKLDLSDLHVYHFDPKEFVPAPAQGVLGIQVNEKNTSINQIIQNVLHHPDVQHCIELERTLLKNLNGGCQMPLGAYCYMSESEYVMHVGYAPTIDVPMKFFDLSNVDREKLIQEATATIHSFS